MNLLNPSSLLRRGSCPQAPAQWGGQTLLDSVETWMETKISTGLYAMSLKGQLLQLRWLRIQQEWICQHELWDVTDKRACYIVQVCCAPRAVHTAPAPSPPIAHRATSLPKSIHPTCLRAQIRTCPEP